MCVFPYPNLTWGKSGWVGGPGFRLFSGGHFWLDPFKRLTFRNVRMLHPFNFYVFFWSRFLWWFIDLLKTILFSNFQIPWPRARKLKIIGFFSGSTEDDLFSGSTEEDLFSWIPPKFLELRSIPGQTLLRRWRTWFSPDLSRVNNTKTKAY